VTASNCSLNSNWSLWYTIACSIASPAPRNAAAASSGAVAGVTPTWARKVALSASDGTVLDELIFVATR